VAGVSKDHNIFSNWLTEFLFSTGTGAAGFTSMSAGISFFFGHGGFFWMQLLSFSKCSQVLVPALDLFTWGDFSYQQYIERDMNWPFPILRCCSSAIIWVTDLPWPFLAMAWNRFETKDWVKAVSGYVFWMW
jgi:hypothetical protein